MFNEDVSNPGDGPLRGFQYEPRGPVQDGGGDPAVARPKAIDDAFRASLAGTVIGGVGMVVTVRLDQLARQLLENNGWPDTAENLAAGAALAKVSLGLGVALYVALFVLFAVKMRAGRNWARMVLTAVAILSAVSFLSAVASTGAALDLMWNLAAVAFSVTAVVYLFRPESTAYFAEHRKRRLARRGGRPHP